MEKKYCLSDSGEVTVRIGSCRLQLPNCYGDGCHKVYHMTEEEFEAYKEEHKEYEGATFKFNYLLRGKFVDAKVMYYDCYDENDFNNNSDVVFTLNGWYNIYANYGKIYFIKYKEE